jgi:predicted exporter
LEEIQKQLAQTIDPLWVVIGGRDEREVKTRLHDVKAVLSTARRNGVVAHVRLPDHLWPWPEAQAHNRRTALALVSTRETLRAVAVTNGFAESALGLANRIFDTWHTASLSDGVYWPTGKASRWIFSKFAGGAPGQQYALGLVEPSGSVSQAALAQLERELAQHHAWLSGWQLLGRAVFDQVQANLWKLITPMVALVLLSLWLAFRSWSAVGLSVAAMTLSGLALLALMRIAGWSWNLLNLMSVPLILGTVWTTAFSCFSLCGGFTETTTPPIARLAVRCCCVAALPLLDSGRWRGRATQGWRAWGSVRGRHSLEHADCRVPPACVVAALHW